MESLTRLGPVVVFSAAIPYQGGTCHINEQWPDYWARRFEKHSYVAIDYIRPRVWQDDNVEWWYAQNTLLFSSRDYVSAHPSLHAALEKTRNCQLSVVHPKRYLGFAQWKDELDKTRWAIASVIPAQEAYVLVDEEYFGDELAGGPQYCPLSVDGRRSGPPSSDDEAIAQLERRRQSGIGFIVFTSAAFWWLDYYCGFHHHLRKNFKCLIENDRTIVFDLHQDLREKHSG